MGLVKRIFLKIKWVYPILADCEYNTQYKNMSVTIFDWFAKHQGGQIEFDICEKNVCIACYSSVLISIGKNILPTVANNKLVLSLLRTIFIN